MSRIASILVGVSLVVMPGCAMLNEGAVDVRRADNRAATAARAIPAESRLLPLQAKNVGTQNPSSGIVASNTISENDVISVSINQAFISTFTEGFGSNPFHSRDNTQGEIAIVATVYEMADKKSIDFEHESGRLIYYSADQRRNHFCNFVNIPIYGPKTYKGTPLVLKLYILELDTEKSEVQALIGELAKLGAKAHSSASPILGILDQMGRVLLNASASQNDLEFSFVCTFTPETNAAPEGVRQFPLEEGNYVFIREEFRENDTPWERIFLNENEGRLYIKKETTASPEVAQQAARESVKEISLDGKIAISGQDIDVKGKAIVNVTESAEVLSKEYNAEYYKDNTYVVVQIRRDFSGKELDLEQNTFEVFLEKRRQHGEERAEYLKQIAAELANQQEVLIAFDDARGALMRAIAIQGKEFNPERFFYANQAMEILKTRAPKTITTAEPATSSSESGTKATPVDSAAQPPTPAANTEHRSDTTTTTPALEGENRQTDSGAQTAVEDAAPMKFSQSQMTYLIKLIIKAMQVATPEDQIGTLEAKIGEIYQKGLTDENVRASCAKVIGGLIQTVSANTGKTVK